MTLPYARTVGAAALAGGLCAAAPLAAGQFDGTYKLTPDADCGLIGREDGALRVKSGVLTGVETECRMTNPVNVRDMQGVLFDMQCSGEGSQWSERALFLRAADGGLILVWDGFAFAYDSCDATGPAKPGE